MTTTWVTRVPMRTFSRLTFICTFFCFYFATSSSAQTLYATGASSKQLFKVDMSNASVTELTALSAKPDSLIVDSEGRILFTGGGATGTVSRYDPSTDSISVVASGLSYPRDLVLDPGQTTILVSNYGKGQIV